MAGALLKPSEVLYILLQCEARCSETLSMSPSNSTLPIRLGFIGLSATGWASNALAPPLFKEPLASKYSLVAVSTTRAESAEASAAKYSKLASEATGKKVIVKSYHGSAEQIAADKDVDMVAVSVRLLGHNEAASKVINAGKDLFIEWPAGNYSEETRGLYDAAKNKGIRSVAKSIVDSGVLGKTVSATFNVSSVWGNLIFLDSAKYFLDPSNSLGLIDILGGHGLDMFTHILGPISSLSAIAENKAPLITISDSKGKPTDEVLPQTKPTQYCVNGLLASGATFSVHFQTAVTETEFLWVIRGEKGTLRIVDEDAKKTGLFAPTPQVYLNGNKVELPAEESRSGLLWEAVAEDREESYATLEDAVRIRNVLDAILRSSKEGRRIDL
ncbi:hypothetical protein D9757_010733 [Collybiopsis confluens]|uniref:Gfo/Idh/MocA-like oxidoreductase N-terminal domain-containing protein n=1 Tax=Collybiopsis confluens TaxID=2823264 RepID=A0A8H5LYC0_9AGAR|nr:hypothetical protein D9757_010733 [Collybiopsis confluens]